MAKRRLTPEEEVAYAEVGRALRRLGAVERRVAMRRDGGPPRCGWCRVLCEAPVWRDPRGRAFCADCAQALKGGGA